MVGERGEGYKGSGERIRATSYRVLRIDNGKLNDGDDV